MKEKIEAIFLQIFGWLPTQPNDPCRQFLDAVIKVVEEKDA
ncbi:MAG: hypothetical protein Q7J69_06055 [Candidatus Omnitrophota bacterium]|nr:hypothetical protein [Candidatus Omnitrophota bacterium]